uniref:Globin family profile domain-containing protein n=1 Tax=Acrobeloides nanus TaxID=290746 RepID=A0A914BV02_9BILA
MGSGACKPVKELSGSVVVSEYYNPFEKDFSKKEKMCLYESYKRLHNPKILIGSTFVYIIGKVAPELKKVFGLENTRENLDTWLKRPVIGRQVSQVTTFFEHIVTMMGFTQNFMGAWLLVRKTGRLHAKIPFLHNNQNGLQTNYFTIFMVVIIREFIPYLTGEKLEPGTHVETCREKRQNEFFKKNYSPEMITNVWTKFFNLIETQLTESFELEHARCINLDNRKIFAPHQHIELAEEKKRRYLEKLKEPQPVYIDTSKPKEELYADPF